MSSDSLIFKRMLWRMNCYTATMQGTTVNRTPEVRATNAVDTAPTDFNFSKELSEIKPGPVNAPR